LTWAVDTTVGEFSYEDSTGTFVGFRVDEELSGLGSTTAVGRTPDVSGTPQWWTLSAVPLQRPGGGAVVTHSDATVRRLTEIAAQRDREQMARTARMLALGELTSSLWHRLSQPLTGIMGNAQAGRRFLESGPSPQEDEPRAVPGHPLVLSCVRLLGGLG